MKIYTKFGDKGKTSLFGGTVVDKDNVRIEAYGTVDELNSFLGALTCQLEEDDIRDVLFSVQNQLFNIGSLLAADPSKKSFVPDLQEGDITFLENAIDDMNIHLPELKYFILPGGSNQVSSAHICRTICRRAERRVITLTNEDNKLSPLIIKYLNRLSDYFFVLARRIGQLQNVPEIKWQPSK